MNALAIRDEMRLGLRALAEPADGIQARIASAARKAGMKYGRAYEIWYGRARRIDAHELETLRAARREQQQAAVKSELAEVYRRLDAVEAHLAGKAEGRAGTALGEEI
jgi:hypothetical protein